MDKISKVLVTLDARGVHGVLKVQLGNETGWEAAIVSEDMGLVDVLCAYGDLMEDAIAELNSTCIDWIRIHGA